MSKSTCPAYGPQCTSPLAWLSPSDKMIHKISLEHFTILNLRWKLVWRKYFLPSQRLQFWSVITFSDTTPKTDCSQESEREGKNSSGSEEEDNDFSRVYQEIDDTKSNFQRAKGMAGNKCPQLYWSSTAVFESCHQAQPHSPIDHDTVKVSITIC